MRRLFLLLLLLAPLALHAALEPDATYKRIDIAYTVNADGSWIMEYHHVVRLQTYLAVNRLLGESFVVYNPDFQKLEILTSETTMADGRKASSQANALNEVLPAAAHGFPDFANLREMVVTHVGLERGAQVEFAYRLTTNAGFLPAFGAREILGRPFPVEKLRITLSGPGTANFRFRTLPKPIQPERSGDNLTFEFSDLPALPSEPFGREAEPPQLLLSAASNWIPALPFDLEKAVLPEALKTRTAEIVRDNPGINERAAALHQLVAGEIDTCPLTWEQTGWRWRSPAAVYASNYGTALEKTVLLTLLFQEAGIPAEPLAVIGGIAFIADVPGPQQIGAFLVKYDAGGDPLFFAPDNAQAEPAPCPWPGRTAWSLKQRKPVHLPVYSAAANGLEISGRLALAGTQARGTLTVSLSGIFQHPRAAALNAKEFVASTLKRVFPGLDVTGARVLEMTPDRLRAEVDIQSAWLQEASEGVRLLPRLAPPLLSEEMVSAPVRFSPLSLGGPFYFSLDLAIEPETGWQADVTAAKLKQENDLGRLNRAIVPAEKGTWRLHLGLEIDASPVPPEQYPMLQELVRPLLAPDYWMILKKN
jgi:hypothetical protein